MATRRRAYNPPTWNRLPPTTRSNYPGGQTAYRADFPKWVSYRTIPSALPMAPAADKAAVRRRRSKAKTKYVRAGRHRRGTRKNPGYVAAPGTLYRIRRQRNYRRVSARNPALVAQVEKTFGKVPFVGKWLGSAAGASVFGLGGAASIYAIRWFLSMESIAEYEWAQWLNTRPHYAYAIGGSLLGLLARVLLVQTKWGDATTARAAQIAVTSAGFGAGALLYLSSEEDLEGFKVAKQQEALEAEQA